MAASNDLRAVARQGNSLIYIARPNSLAAETALDSNWVCECRIVDGGGGEVVATFAVTAKHIHESSEYFLIEIERTTTADIPVGNYYLLIEIRNDVTSPKYAVETPVELKIDPQYITVS